MWLVPALPLLAAGLSAILKKSQRTLAASLAIGAMALSLLLSLGGFVATLTQSGLEESGREFVNFPWLQIGDQWLRLGWILDPLSAVMLVMVCFVGLLIFIYSVGYMAKDDNFTRFFCFLSLFAAGMLGVVISNSLLLLFICWELVGLTSYLLIGFWYHKPSAAAAAKKAFITTRVGDLALLLGMVWLYSQAGTLLFYDNGKGCLEQNALASLVARGTMLGMATSTGVALLIFFGAVGKSGQVPLHVWLPDAMEGPTPVSALIHAATMVAAGVFLVCRTYPLMALHPPGIPGSPALQVVTWVGTITAVFAATVAVAQTDIKRILAYSTVSQLGFMMLGLGVGGVAVAMFHLITHAFFKALLFMGAGSVIHGCHEEQDIRRMGGLKKFMPITFVTYAIGMLALSGFPLLFSGFWSKDEILHSAHGWEPSRAPFFLGLFAALLTAFYMTRQVLYVFFGDYEGAHAHDGHGHSAEPHESPPVMWVPLAVLAFFAVVLGFLGTPAWPWFQSFLEGKVAATEAGALFERGFLGLVMVSSLVVFAGLGLGFWFYGRTRPESPSARDPLEIRWPNLWALLRGKYFIDEIYEATVIRFTQWSARACDWLDRWVWDSLVQLAGYTVVGLAWVSRSFDEFVVNVGFDQVCSRFVRGGKLMSRLQGGQIQSYLRVIAVALSVLVLILIWGCKRV